MTCNVIASGSSGNATIINDNILIDCGVPYVKLRPFASALQIVLLTHIHSDHFNFHTVRKLFDQHPKIRFACCEWMVWPLISANVFKDHIHVMEPDMNYSFSNGLTVSPFATLHNVPNCGWRIFLPNKEKVLYATDLSTMEGIEAKAYDLYLIEMNHKREEIEAKIAEKTAAGEFSYEVEAARNHLSEEQALDWLAENAGPYSKFIPMHQHVDKEGRDGV